MEQSEAGNERCEEGAILTSLSATLGVIILGTLLLNVPGLAAYETADFGVSWDGGFGDAGGATFDIIGKALFNGNSGGAMGDGLVLEGVILAGGEHVGAVLVVICGAPLGVAEMRNLTRGSEPNVWRRVKAGLSDGAVK